MRARVSVGLIVLLLAAPVAAGPFYGVAQSMDGDSLRVGDREVRLFGIDAPEFDQFCKRGGQDWACGQEAADRLSKLVTGREVSCTSMGTDKYDRTLARCTVNGTDINRTMVATGYAVAFRQYSMDYISAEESAKANKRGLWSGTFELPSEVRHAGEQPRPAEPASRMGRMPVVSSVRSRPQASGGCLIKGNQGRHGRIYHLPGMKYYAETVAEQMFCTEAAAQAAGYRRARAGY